ncbi:SSI family serine proteinase inhibitor [Streptomyces sp. SCSIO 30461]|uniref:SSI family serine proteinase inhibitor n=1 Tax=Streptomyces sp. SCSIO 30461 TaxID=3118085 RepID=UPI0030CAFC6D
MLRRLAMTATASVATLLAVAPGAPASADPAAGPAPAPAPAASPAETQGLPLPLLQPEEPTDRLIVTTAQTGNPRADGTYELNCGPAGGSHPAAKAACARLERLGEGGKDPFAPVGEDRMCAQQYGGPATARVKGTWRGKPVDATFARRNGCEIGRWRAMEPVLPTARS